MLTAVIASVVFREDAAVASEMRGGKVWSSAIDVAVFQPILVVLSREISLAKRSTSAKTSIFCRCATRPLKKSMIPPLIRQQRSQS